MEANSITSFECLIADHELCFHWNVGMEHVASVPGSFPAFLRRELDWGYGTWDWTRLAELL